MNTKYFPVDRSWVSIIINIGVLAYRFSFLFLGFQDVKY